MKVIVVGGGIIGASTAYYLTKQGVEVTLVESNDFASGSSSSCDTAISLVTKKPGPVLDIAIESASLYSELEEELDCDFEYKNQGGVVLFEEDSHISAMKALSEAQEKSNFFTEILDKKEVTDRYPGVSNHILGGIFSPTDAKVNSYKVVFSYIIAAKRNGCKVINFEPVIRLIKKGDKIIGVETTKEKYYADKVILASGIWTSQLTDPLDLKVPIIPRRGHIIVTEKTDHVFNGNILSTNYILSKSGTGDTDEKNMSNAQRLGVGLVMGKTNSGNLLIGGSREFVGFDRSTSREVLLEIANAASVVFPILKQVKIIRTFAGLRPYTPDSLPIMSKVDQYEGLYINAGHEGDGIALAPIAGLLMSELVTGENPRSNLNLFNLNRFESREYQYDNL